MSRESAASLSVANVAGLPERPEPPSALSGRESEIWRDTVATKPADWFMRDSQPILASYCKLVALNEELTKRLDSVDVLTADPKELDKLIGMVCKTAGLAANLATKLRLTQQSRYTPATAARKNVAATVRPWETVKSDPR